MLFLRYESFRQYVRLYPANTALLAVMLVLFLAQRIFPVLTFRLMATNIPPASQEIWRYLTAVFLHAGWMHLLFNAFALFVFAPPLERLFGSWKYVLFFLLCGIFGNVGALSFAGGQPVSVVGASGSIYGVFGAYLYMALFQRHMLDPQSRTTVYAILAMGALFSLIIPNVSFMAHFFGVFAGFVLYRWAGADNLR
ncbi:MAG: rhomboid family intramembrane serine protease [Paenibacillaceae bacterium ZCTH02-B3]|nr:MAG: rhomboid family intramembrane serine protease [Paenibacillaceae bacterium ZCTH02-B3]